MVGCSLGFWGLFSKAANLECEMFWLDHTILDQGWDFRIGGESFLTGKTPCQNGRLQR